MQDYWCATLRRPGVGGGSVAASMLHQPASATALPVRSTQFGACISHVLEAGKLTDHALVKQLASAELLQPNVFALDLRAHARGRSPTIRPIREMNGWLTWLLLA